MKITNRKGQAASEMIVTYGFAVLVVVVALSFLVYFTYKPQTPYLCIFPIDMSCSEHPSFDPVSDEITIVLQNNLGYSVTILDNVRISDCENPIVLSVNGTAPPTVISDKNKFVVVISCPGLNPGKFKDNVQLKYTSVSGLTQSIEGSIQGTA